MSAIIRPSGLTSLKCDACNRLAEARLPNGALVRYEYGDELMPIKITLNGQPALEYKWSRFIHLEKCVDHMSGLTFCPQYRKGIAGQIRQAVAGAVAVEGFRRDGAPLAGQALAEFLGNLIGAKSNFENAAKAIPWIGKGALNEKSKRR